MNQGSQWHLKAGWASMRLPHRFAPCNDRKSLTPTLILPPQRGRRYISLILRCRRGNRCIFYLGLIIEFIFCKMVDFARWTFCWASFLVGAWKDRYILILGSVPEGRRTYQEPSENIIFKTLERAKVIGLVFFNFKS